MNYPHAQLNAIKQKQTHPVLVSIPRIPSNYSLSIGYPSTHTFVLPTLKIQTEHVAFTESDAYFKLLYFIQAVNSSVTNKKISDECLIQPNIQRILDMLDTIFNWIKEIPPLDTPQRFGNRAFKTFIQKLKENSERLLGDLMGIENPAIVELKVYLDTAFGNETRIDYGSGHELAFVGFLCGLYLIGFIQDQDMQATGLQVFNSYLKICRELQSVYKLEPAGSHGVWGLDDFQFLSYYWGAAQLLDHVHVKPKSSNDMDVIEHCYKDYLYFACIWNIHQMKTGPFHEHSPILYDMTAVVSWSKVNTGLLKMFCAEVLQKFPVIQHLQFGSILSFEKHIE